MDGIEEIGLQNVANSSMAEIDDVENLLLNKFKLNLERWTSFDERRSFSEFSGGLGQGGVGLECFKSTCSSPGAKSSLDSPSVSAWEDWLEPHSLVPEAWEALRQSLVYFRGKPIGTVAAYVHASEDVLNYDQVKV